MDDRLPRKLAAILYADVAGYSRLTGEDEDATHRRLSEYLDLISATVEDHRGRVMHYAGDAVLVRFDAIVDAMSAAVAIQNELNTRNEDLPDERKVQFRIGVNSGDVIEDRGDIYGDGVNVAARLESLATPGGICLSDAVRTAVGKKLDLDYEDMGEVQVKNITEPVRTFRVLMDKKVERGATQTESAVVELPDKLSIAVLPFTNMSSDPEQEFFADGITEDIITALSRIPDLFVISRNSTFIYKGRAVRPDEVARDLGVRYILEGSVRVSRNRIRVTAQLIDGQSGHHLWAEKFDRALDDVFELQDELTRNIAVALQIKLTYGDLARLWEGQTKSLAAWEKMVHGRALFFRFNAADNIEARRCFQEAVELDPDYSGAWVQLGLTYWWDARFRTDQDPEESLELAAKLADQVLDSGHGDSVAYILRGQIAFIRRQYDEAIKNIEIAIELAPSDSWAPAILGLVLIYAGQPDRAIEWLRSAMQLSPTYPNWYTYNLATAFLWSGRHEEALETAKKYRALEPRDPYGYVNLATILTFMGDGGEATKVVSDLKAGFPAFSMRDVTRSQVYREPDKLDRVIAALREAGLPE